jgi:hypothetical protein
MVNEWALKLIFFSASVLFSQVFRILAYAVDSISVTDRVEGRPITNLPFTKIM